MPESILDFEEGWTKMIADLKEPKTFHTIGGRSKFTVQRANDGIEFAEDSPYEGCILERPIFRKLYQKFVRIKSWNTTDYLDTRHASYLLRLLKEYFTMRED